MMARNSLFAGAQAIVSSLSLFAMYHLVSRHAGVEVLGFWSVAAAVASLVGAADCGVPDATVRQVAERRAQCSDGWTRVVWTAVLFVSVVVAVACVIALPAVAWIVRNLFTEVGVEGSYLFAMGALFVAWCSACSTTVQGVVEGLERYDIRFAASVLANVSAVLVTFALVPTYGATGFVAGLVTQSLASLLAQGLFVVRETVRFGGFAPGLSDLRPLIAVGLPLRMASLSYFAFEPLTRVLVGRFGGAEMAGIFEGASRLVGQLRAMIVSAAQAIVPRLTALHTVGDAGFVGLLQSVTARMRTLAVICMTGTVLLLPCMSFAIVARIESNFVLIGTIMALAWYLNLRSVPAYFANLAQRRLKWNVLSHIVLGLLNLILGLSLGRTFGAIGVAVGTALALGAASQLVLWSRRDVDKTRVSEPFRSRVLVLVSGLCTIGFGAMNIAGDLVRQPILWSLAAAAGYGVFVAFNRFPAVSEFCAAMRKSNG